MQKVRFIRAFHVAATLGLASAMPAAATSASSYSGAGEPAAGESAIMDTATGGSSGSGGQSALAGIDTVRAEHHVRASDWAGWIGALVLLVLIVLAAVRLRHELRRERTRARR